MQELVNYLLQLGQLSRQEIDLVIPTVIFRPLRNGDYFSPAGVTANEAAFVLNGILRLGTTSATGQQTTDYFVAENDVVIDLEGTPYQAPPSEYIQAVMKTDLAIFPAAGLKSLSAAIPGWDKVFNDIIARTLLAKAGRITPAVAEDATTRYRNFLENHSTIAARIPLSHLASYLGITQQSLSRIRKQLAKRHFPPYGR